MIEELLVDLLNRLFLWLLNSKRLRCHGCGKVITAHQEFNSYGRTIFCFSIFDIDSLGVFCEKCKGTEERRFWGRYRPRTKKPKAEEPDPTEEEMFGDSEPYGVSMSLRERASPGGKEKWEELVRQMKERESNR